MFNKVYLFNSQLKCRVKRTRGRPRMSNAIVRTYEEDCAFLRQTDPNYCELDVGLVPNMRVPGKIYVRGGLQKMLLEELRQYHTTGGTGFLPALYQIGNVASLPGIVGQSIALPDVHSGYGFAIGNVAAFDMDDPEAIVSPGTISFSLYSVIFKAVSDSISTVEFASSGQTCLGRMWRRFKTNWYEPCSRVSRWV